MNPPAKRSALVLQRCIQALSLAVFLGLILSAGTDIIAGLRPDFLLHFDPLAAITLPLAAREFMPGLLPGLVILVVSLIFGGVFCGYFCPLGFTFDLARGVLRLLTRPFRPRLKPGEIETVPGAPEKDATDETKVITRGWYGFKYLALTAVLVTAALGFNAAFWGAPLSLAARFYLLCIQPLMLQLGGLGLETVRALTSGSALQYTVLDVRTYSGLTFLLIFFGFFFLMELVRPRFWCRYVCPAGAIIGFLSRFAFWRRRVKKCVSCGRCTRTCPLSAIAPDGITTARAECTACRTCVDVCPVKGVEFSFSSQGELAAPEYMIPAPVLRRPVRAEAKEDILEQEPDTPFTCTLPSRRAFIGATAGGCLLGFIHFISVKRLLARNTGPNARPLNLLRPPGAAPEAAFLAKCTRCGLCMKACPSNGLQPAWGTAWVEDIFTPELIPQRGPCEPDCNACGQVCPTHALMPLSLSEKKWAKIGTAEVIQRRCIAYAEGRSCVVCQEVCPYGAIELVRVHNVSAPVPVVKKEACYGCGYCEYHCPASPKAVLTRPAGALRLESLNYKQAALAQGLSLLPKEGPAYEPGVEDEIAPGDLPPGFVQ